MPEKNNKKQNNENLAVLEQKSKGFSGILSQERAYEILSQGVIFTMEDDLREAAKRQKIKTDLIPNQIKKESSEQEIFAENPFFDPFQKLEEVKEKTPEKIGLETLPIQKEFEKGEAELPLKQEIPQKVFTAEKAMEKEVVPQGETPKISQFQEQIQKQKEKEISVEKEMPPKEEIEIKQEQDYKETQKPVILKEIIGENIEKIKQNLGQKALDISSKLKDINVQEEPLLQRRKAILEKIALQEKALENFFQKTESVQLEKIKLEEQEQDAKDSQIKHSVEEQRWQAEEKLKQAQDLQWAQEEELEKAQMALSKIDNDLKNFSEQKGKFEKEKAEIQKFLGNINFFVQKEEFLSKSKNFLNQKAKLETSYKEALLQKEKQEKDFLLITQEEQKIESDLKIFEDRVQKATDYHERRKLEQERRELAQKRQLQEKKRWELERNQEAVKNNFNLAKEKFFNAKQEEESFNQKIAEIEARIDKSVFLSEAEKYLKPEIKTKVQEKTSSQEEKDVKEENKKEAEFFTVPLQPAIVKNPIPAKDIFLSEQEEEIVKKIRLQAKEREQELVQKQVVQKQVIEGKQALQAEIRQKQEEEDRVKAIAKLKQIAEQEQQKAFAGKLKGPLLKEEILKKLTKISAQEESQRKEFLSKINKKINLLPKKKQKSFEEAVVFHPMIKKTSLFEKIIIRLSIIFTIIVIGAGVYFGILWLINKQQNNVSPVNNFPSTSTDQTNGWPNLYPDNSTTSLDGSINVLPSTTTQDNATSSVGFGQAETTATPTIANPPAPLIPVSKNNIFSFQGDSSALLSFVEDIVNGDITYNNFEQASVLSEGAFFTAPQLFEALGVFLPKEIFGESGTSTALVYSSKYGNRLGFVLETNSDSSLMSVFRNWESAAESSTASIFNLMGKKSSAISKVFKNTAYKKVPIRYQTFALTDLGVCYAVYKNYFIWTSSLEQMQRMVDKLP